MVVLLVSAAQEALNAAHFDCTLLPLRLPAVHERALTSERRCKPQSFNAMIIVLVVASAHLADTGSGILVDAVRPRSASLVYPKANTCFILGKT